MGEIGVDACPAGYSPIHDAAICEGAAGVLDLPLHVDCCQVEDGGECFKASSGFVNFHDGHGSGAQWVCQELFSVDGGRLCLLSCACSYNLELRENNFVYFTLVFFMLLLLLLILYFMYPNAI